MGVEVVDTLPEGLTLMSLPVLDGWTCTADGQVMTCNREQPLPVDATETLAYVVQVVSAAPVGEELVNVATVTSETTDPDPSNNQDDDTTRRVTPPPPEDPPDEVLPVTIPAPEPLPAVEVTPPAPPLAVTGVESGILAFAAAALTASGAVLIIGGRRRRFEHDEY